MTLVISPALLGELAGVLAYPKLTAIFDDPAALVAAVADAADTVDPAERVTVLADEQGVPGSIFRGFALYLGWAARAGTHVPERIEEEKYRQCQVEDRGGQRQEDADNGRAGLEQHC